MTVVQQTGTTCKVWIVLVNWNGWRDSIECLESVLRLDYPNFGVILCDNDSSDGSLESITEWAEGRLPFVAPAGPLAHLVSPPLAKPLTYRLIEAGSTADPDALACDLLLVRTGGNLGFAGGNNVGIRLALADPDCGFVWLLNNDTVVAPDCLSHMVVKGSSTPAIGITGSLNCFYGYPDVIQAIGGGYFNRRKVKSDLHGHGLLAAQVTEESLHQAEARLDWVSGASMLVSRAFLQTIGEMEERYFLYYEEIDWALRSESHFRNALASRARVFHKAGSATGEGGDSEFSLYTQYRSRFKLYRKFMPELMPACYVRSLVDLLKALLRRRRSAIKALLRAGRDDLCGS